MIYRILFVYLNIKSAYLHHIIEKIYNKKRCDIIYHRKPFLSISAILIYFPLLSSSITIIVRSNPVTPGNIPFALG